MLMHPVWKDETFMSHIFGGLTWALDGASTRAYGVGIVGNDTTPPPPPPPKPSVVANASATDADGSNGTAGGNLTKSGAISARPVGATIAVVGVMAAGLAIVL